jgi:large subunit ribosomal protein L31e
MAKKTEEPKAVLEKEYTVPLRKGWLKVPKYKRANKAVKTLKEFLVRHMKVYDRDLRKIKLDIELNNEIRFRGMKKPACKIKVRAKKFDDGIVRVSLIDLPNHIKFARLKEKKLKKEDKKKVEEKKVEGKKGAEEDYDEEEEVKNNKKEKIKVKPFVKSTKEKHISKDKDVKIKRKALSR